MCVYIAQYICNANQSLYHACMTWHVFLQDAFNISKGIDGSVRYYTIYIGFLGSESSCSLATIPVSSCVGGICNYIFTNLTSLSCHGHSSQAVLNVTALASNALGDGFLSVPLFVGIYACMFSKDTCDVLM